MAKKTTKKVNNNELDGQEFFAAIAQIEQEKGIKPGYMMEKITQALLSAYRRDHEGVGDNLVIDADPDTCTVRLFLKKDIVEEVDNPATEISLEEARAALPAAGREEARRALSGLENERCALRAGMDAAASALAKARQDYAAAEAAVTALTAQQTETGEAADLPALESQRDTLTARRTALAAQEKALTARLLPNRKAADLYRQHAAARAELERRWQWVNALASTAGGTLSSKQKIRLEAYIQMNYLDAILVHANTRLMQMTAGQYELERVGAENQRSQSGLDLGVIDHYNGTRRSVKTLSGGESFKASLALALGLSDEVQGAAGGIRLDTLFLDEGFGSLDDESLEQAIRVLAGLTEGDRLVGIISHVAALKERIDKQVVVKKARSGGSTVEVIV